jgi:hypothetical protein
MLQYVNVTIDGAPVRAEKGTSVLDTAIHVGVCIPHLCHIPGIHDMGACRLCIVEEVKNGRSKVTASCTLLVEEGMVIKSNTDKILKMRKNIAELLVAQAPNSKAIQDIAVRCGVKNVRYPFRNEDCVLGAGEGQCPGVHGARQGPPRRPPPGEAYGLLQELQRLHHVLPHVGHPLRRAHEEGRGAALRPVRLAAQRRRPENARRLRMVRAGKGVPVQPLPGDLTG